MRGLLLVLSGGPSPGALLDHQSKEQVPRAVPLGWSALQGATAAASAARSPAAATTMLMRTATE